jgi:hypothetical protein
LKQLAEDANAWSMTKRWVTQKCARHGHREIAFNVSDLAPHPEWLVAYLESAVESGSQFLPEETLQVGWMLTQFRGGKDGTLELWEPDFQAVPIEWKNDLNETLRHLTLQKAVCELAGSEIDLPTLSQGGIVSPGFRNAIDFTMSRDMPEQADSGWIFTQLGYAGEEGEYQSLYQIALWQPRVIPFLGLSPATNVSCERGQIEIMRETVNVSSVENTLLRQLVDSAARR